MAGEYVFIDEWDVDAPIDAVYQALADARTYPEWWTPVYIRVEADGPPEVGASSRQEFKGQLPYHLKTTSTITAADPPRSFSVEVVGDLTGKGVWTLTERSGKVHVHFDWRVIADRALLRYLTPILRPLFRHNHNWSIKRAIEGLEPYAKSHAAGSKVG